MLSLWEAILIFQHILLTQKVCFNICPPKQLTFIAGLQQVRKHIIRHLRSILPVRTGS